MVVLFLAGDHFLSAALERDPELLERALARKVLLATPVTLISVLKGIAYGWRQEKLANNAVELRRVAAELHDRIRLFADSYAESGRSAGQGGRFLQPLGRIVGIASAPIAQEDARTGCGGRRRAATRLD